MHALDRIHRFLWFFLFWLGVFGIGLVGAFLEFRHLLPVSVPPLAEKQAAPLKVALPAGFQASPSAQAVWVYDRISESVIYELRSEEATAVASLAKLMTALVAREQYASSEAIMIASGAGVLGNKAGFLPRDVFRSDDLIKAMLIFSANDAAWSLAAAHPNGVPGFLQAMNVMAERLQLRATHFENAYGWDHVDQYSSAADIGVIADRVLHDPFLADVVATSKAVIREQRTGRPNTLYSTNLLLREGTEFQGVKTGTTEWAGQSLVVRYVASAPAQLQPAQESLDLIMVILGSQDRFQEARQLLRMILPALQIRSS